MILGNDWLKEYKVSIDYDSEKLFYGSSPRESIPFVYRNVNQYQGTFNIKVRRYSSGASRRVPREIDERIAGIPSGFQY